MLLMSSIMLTVLPTPAPPNRPILPPFANGQIRSITLIPVSSSSVDGDSSSNAGAFWWIERIVSLAIGPASSIGRPSTSMMRPSVGLPTGTLIGFAVFFTTTPRRRPSDEPRQMVRTTPSPSCCWTSSVSSEPSRMSASYTFGMCVRGNSTSITAPMHCTILPSTKAVVLIAFPLDTQFFTRATARLVARSLFSLRGRFRLLTVALRRSSLRSDCRGAADDLRQFLRDRGLAALVVHQLQLVDDRLRVVRSGLHRDHACRLFRRHVFRDGLIDQRFDITHEQFVDHR